MRPFSVTGSLENRCSSLRRMRSPSNWPSIARPLDAPKSNPSRFKVFVLMALPTFLLSLPLYQFEGARSTDFSVQTHALYDIPGIHALCSAETRLFGSNPQYPQGFPQKTPVQRWILADFGRPRWIIQVQKRKVIHRNGAGFGVFRMARGLFRTGLLWTSRGYAAICPVLPTFCSKNLFCGGPEPKTQVFSRNKSRRAHSILCTGLGSICLKKRPVRSPPPRPAGRRGPR